MTSWKNKFTSLSAKKSPKFLQHFKIMHLGHLFNYTENISPNISNSAIFHWPFLSAALTILWPNFSFGNYLSSIWNSFLQFQLTQCHLLPVPNHSTGSYDFLSYSQPQHSRTQARRASAMAITPDDTILSHDVPDSLGTNELQADAFTLLSR